VRARSRIANGAWRGRSSAPRPRCKSKTRRPWRPGRADDGAPHPRQGSRDAPGRRPGPRRGSARSGPRDSHRRRNATRLLAPLHGGPARGRAAGSSPRAPRRTLGERAGRAVSTRVPLMRSPSFPVSSALPWTASRSTLAYGSARGDRERLERVCRHVARPALSGRALSLSKQGNVLLRLRRPWRDGTTSPVFEPLTFIERLTALVSPAFPVRGRGEPDRGRSVGVSTGWSARRGGPAGGPGGRRGPRRS
jgi:hypothetical protein